MKMSTNLTSAASCLFLVAGLLPASALAQTDDAARRQAILQLDELVTEDGQLIDQDATLVRATRATYRSSPDSTPFQEVRWGRGGYYGRSYYRPYGGYYYGPRTYARYPRYYDPYRSYYGPRYGYYGYSYPYYGRPYGAARVGPMRFYW